MKNRILTSIFLPFFDQNDFYSTASRDAGEGRTWRVREKKQVFNTQSSVRQCIYASAASYILNGEGDTGIKGFKTPNTELPYRGAAHRDNPTSGR